MKETKLSGVIGKSVLRGGPIPVMGAQGDMPGNAVREPEVWASLSEMEKMICELENAVEKLGIQLDPVLRQTEEKNVLGVDLPRTPTCTSLGGRLEEQNSRISRLIDNVHGLRTRLEI